MIRINIWKNHVLVHTTKGNTATVEMFMYCMMVERCTYSGDVADLHC
jgi:hypothetical protein